jgi:K+-sensing histidine kinase KdpD
MYIQNFAERKDKQKSPAQKRSKWMWKIPAVIFYILISVFILLHIGITDPYSQRVGQLVLALVVFIPGVLISKVFSKGGWVAISFTVLINLFLLAWIFIGPHVIPIITLSFSWPDYGQSVLTFIISYIFAWVVLL